MVDIDPRIAEIMPFPKEAIFFIATVGSTCHGTELPGKNGGIDDKDIAGSFLPSLNSLFGLETLEHWDPDIDELDLTFYEFRKFIRLLVKSNPNVFPILWMREEDFIYQSIYFKILRASRNMFISDHTVRAFSGYARSQIKDMDREHAYRGYMGARRKALVDKIGYDPKYASHAVRLLRMACEFTETYNLEVYRHDAKELIEIKTGQWSFSQVQEECRDKLAFLDAWAGDTNIPKEPNIKAINTFMTTTLYDWIRKNDDEYRPIDDQSIGH